jgi:hypothetical protein
LSPVCVFDHHLLVSSSTACAHFVHVRKFCVFVKLPVALRDSFFTAWLLPPSSIMSLLHGTMEVLVSAEPRSTCASASCHMAASHSCAGDQPAVAHVLMLLPDLLQVITCVAVPHAHTLCLEMVGLFHGKSNSVNRLACPLDKCTRYRQPGIPDHERTQVYSDGLCHPQGDNRCK